MIPCALSNLHHVYLRAVQPALEDEEIAARCETVLNTTMAEMDTYHTQKVEDFRNIVMEHLDGEIAFYEQVGYQPLYPCPQLH